MINIIILSNPKPHGFLAHALYDFIQAQNALNVPYKDGDANVTILADNGGAGIVTEFGNYMEASKIYKYPYYLVDCWGYLPNKNRLMRDGKLIAYNVCKTAEALDWIQAYPSGILIQPLSSHIYHEETAYALSKKMQQDMCNHFGKTQKVVGIMLPPLYGVNRHTGFVYDLIVDFLEAKQDNMRAIEVKSHPLTQLSLLNVMDAARVIYCLIRRLAQYEPCRENKYYYEEYSVSPPPETIDNLVELIKNHIEYDGDINFTESYPVKRVIDDFSTVAFLRGFYKYEYTPFSEYLKNY